MSEVQAEGECRYGVAPFLPSGLYVPPFAVHPSAEASDDESAVSGAWLIVSFLVWLVAFAGLIATSFAN